MGYAPSAMAEESEDKGVETIRKTCTLAVASVRRLERLAKRAANFIEAGLRDAIERGYIKLKDDE